MSLNFTSEKELRQSLAGVDKQFVMDNIDQFTDEQLAKLNYVLQNAEQLQKGLVEDIVDGSIELDWISDSRLFVGVLKHLRDLEYSPRVKSKSDAKKIRAFIKDQAVRRDNAFWIMDDLCAKMVGIKLKSEKQMKANKSKDAEKDVEDLKLSDKFYINLAKAALDRRKSEKWFVSQCMLKGLDAEKACKAYNDAFPIDNTSPLARQNTLGRGLNGLGFVSVNKQLDKAEKAHKDAQNELLPKIEKPEGHDSNYIIEKGQDRSVEEILAKRKYIEEGPTIEKSVTASTVDEIKIGKEMGLSDDQIKEVLKD